MADEHYTTIAYSFLLPATINSDTSTTFPQPITRLPFTRSNRFSSHSPQPVQTKIKTEGLLPMGTIPKESSYIITRSFQISNDSQHQPSLFDTYPDQTQNTMGEVDDNISNAYDSQEIPDDD